MITNRTKTLYNAERTAYFGRVCECDYTTITYKIIKGIN